jgi:hypothetical protein
MYFFSSKFVMDTETLMPVLFRVIALLLTCADAG